MFSSTIQAQSKLTQYANAQETVPFGIVERIQSESIGEERILNVCLPFGYHPDSAATYPVIYLLDGSAHEDYPHVAGLIQFLNMYELIPNTILVGIENVDRYRDFSFPSDDTLDLESLPTSGGGEQFIRFLETECKPFIEKKYNTNGHSTIVGQSMGGLIATEILIKNEQLFDDYIIISPSLWWNQQELVNGAREHFRGNTTLEGKIFISLGQEHPVMHDVANMLIDAIRNSGNTEVELYYEPIRTEDHATILHKAIYRAFEFFYPKKVEEEGD